MVVFALYLVVAIIVLDDICYALSFPVKYADRVLHKLGVKR